jgi:hypothetical protein
MRKKIIGLAAGLLVAAGAVFAAGAVAPAEPSGDITAAVWDWPGA